VGNLLSVDLISRYHHVHIHPGRLGNHGNGGNRFPVVGDFVAVVWPAYINRRPRNPIPQTPLTPILPPRVRIQHPSAWETEPRNTPDSHPARESSDSKSKRLGNDSPEHHDSLPSSVSKSRSTGN